VREGDGGVQGLTSAIHPTQVPEEREGVCMQPCGGLLSVQAWARCKAGTIRSALLFWHACARVRGAPVCRLFARTRSNLDRTLHICLYIGSMDRGRSCNHRSCTRVAVAPWGEEEKGRVGAEQAPPPGPAGVRPYPKAPREPSPQGRTRQAHCPSLHARHWASRRSGPPRRA
jgi:hypothetical protein